jgi:hypothetical protein
MVSMGERTACLGERPDGTPAGATVFLTPDQLRRLGVDPAGDAMCYRVKDGDLLVTDE